MLQRSQGPTAARGGTARAIKSRGPGRGRGGNRGRRSDRPNARATGCACCCKALFGAPNRPNTAWGASQYGTEGATGGQRAASGGIRIAIRDTSRRDGTDHLGLVAACGASHAEAAADVVHRRLVKSSGHTCRAIAIAIAIALVQSPSAPTAPHTREQMDALLRRGPTLRHPCPTATPEDQPTEKSGVQTPSSNRSSCSGGPSKARKLSALARYLTTARPAMGGWSVA